MAIRTITGLSLLAAALLSAGAAPAFAAPDYGQMLAQAQDMGEQAPIELGDEYTEYRKDRSAGGGSGRSRGMTTLRNVVLFIPNRIFDFLDIFRADVGIGPSTGFVVRVTEWGQVGCRSIHPFSLRAGLRGRRKPLFIERQSEFGIGPAFETSAERAPTPLEVGAGADLLIAGAYLGISIDSIFDFFAGFVGADLDRDDL